MTAAHEPTASAGDPAQVAVVMGSDSDLDCMRPAIETLDRFGVTREVRVVSAHRRPHDMLEYGTGAAERGLQVIIAGAGGAAHLPGMLASVTRLPVIGVPVPLRRLDGLDSLLSIVQMPRGVPVATVAIAGAENAALLACRMLALADPELAVALDEHREELRVASTEADLGLRRGVGQPDSPGV
jgi:5-(carboxyamino)imidazole ribonucleotide mutase